MVSIRGVLQPGGAIEAVSEMAGSCVGCFALRAGLGRPPVWARWPQGNERGSRRHRAVDGMKGEVISKIKNSNHQGWRQPPSSSFFLYSSARPPSLHPIVAPSMPGLAREVEHG